MTCQLTPDCLNEIFEYLEEDKFSLHSCLLVNRLWCKISVRILWKNIWEIQYSVSPACRAHVPFSIISTLVACLPNESKDLIYEVGISIASPTLFNYASFCKVLSIDTIDRMIKHVLSEQQSIAPRSLQCNKYLVLDELLKMFMNQISSLEFLDYYDSYNDENIMFTGLPKAKNCLGDLVELSCSSEIQSGFFFQMSHICRNIQSLTINFGDCISNGLADLISSQNNLKSLTLHNDFDDDTIASSLRKFTSTLIKLEIIETYVMSFSFIAEFTNLQELIVSLNPTTDDLDFLDFDQLQYIFFPHLKVLKFLVEIENNEIFTKFLEWNGKNLNELHLGNSNCNVDLAIEKHCPNLKILFASFKNSDMEALKAILNNCQYLENMRVLVGGDGEYISERTLFEVIAKYSPKNFHKIKLHYQLHSKMDPINLEFFLVSWKNRISKKSLILIVNSRLENDENKKIVEKYMELNVIRRVEVE